MGGWVWVGMGGVSRCASHLNVFVTTTVSIIVVDDVGVDGGRGGGCASNEPQHSKLQPNTPN